MRILANTIKGVSTLLFRNKNKKGVSTHLFGNKWVLTPFLLCVNLPVFAVDLYYDDFPPSERFKVRIGSFFIDRYDTTVRFDSRQFPIGTLIDLEDNFNVDSRETVLRMDGFYRFNQRHRIDWSYYKSRRDGQAVATNEFVIGDPDDPEGGFVIPKDARIETKWNFDLFKVGYAWSFLNKREYEMYVGGGLNLRNLDFEISYQATVGVTSGSDSIEATGLVPLPTGAIGGRWNFGGKWQANFHYELFVLNIGDYSGTQQEILLLFEHNTFQNIGFGTGFNMINLNLRAKTDEFRGEFDSRILGLLVYIKAYF